MLETERLLLRNQDRSIRALHHQYKSLNEFEDATFLPTPTAVARVREAIATLRSELAQVEMESPVARLYHKCFEDSLECFDATIEDDRFHPYRSISSLSGVVRHLVMTDSRDPQIRADILMSRASAAMELARVVKARCEVVGRDTFPHVRKAFASLALVAMRAKEAVPKQFADQSPALVARINGALSNIEGMAKREIRVSLEPAGDEKIARLNYDSMLRRLYDVSLGDLLLCVDDEIKQCHHALIELCKTISKDEPPILLARELPACDLPDAMFQHLQTYMKRARTESLNYVDLPEGETCNVTPVPEQLRDSFPWGGYAGGCVYRRPLVGEVFANEANYAAISKGWLMTLAIHECYPGHHTQWVKLHSGSLPETIKLGAKSTPLIEGAAHRSEELLQYAFPERAFPAFVAYRRLHTALRIKADLELHINKKTLDQVMKLYQRYLGLKDEPARGQVTYQQRNPGYMVCYYYGYRALKDIESRYAISQKDFTELLFSCGPISIPNFETLVGMEPALRQEYLRGLENAPGGTTNAD